MTRVWGLVNENLDLFAGGEAALRVPARPDAGDAGVRLLKKMHQTIRKVGEDIEVRFHLNTAISSIMEFHNLIRKEKDGLRETEAGRAVLGRVLETLVTVLSPFAPHMAEELWERTGHRGLLMHSRWPVYDEDLAREEMATIVVQINGKLRDKFEAELDLPEKEMEARALALPKVQAQLAAKPARKVVCVKNRLVNIVV